MIKTDTTNTFSYVSSFLSEEEYLNRLNNVELIKPSNPITEGAFPSIALPSTLGKELLVAELAKEKNVIVFFYPGDKEGLNYPELAGCTAEACAFRNNYRELEQLNTTVVGISFQTTERQQELVESQHLNFPLLSDANQALAKALRLPYWRCKSNLKKIFPARQTFIIAKGNRIHKIFKTIQPEHHLLEVLTEIKNILVVTQKDY